MARPKHKINQLKRHLQQFVKKRPKVSCQYPVEVCQMPTVENHSIQKKGPLKKLADSHGKVLQFKMHLTFDQPPTAVIKPVGIGEATTFYCLCGEHDNEMWKQIEGFDIDPANIEQSFLLGYRAYLRDYYFKLCEVDMSQKACDYLGNDQEFSATVRKVSFEYLKRAKFGLSRFEQLKKEFEKSYVDKSWAEAFSFLFFEIAGPHTLAVSSAFTPYYDFQKQEVNDMRLGSLRSLNVIVINAFPHNENTLVSICISKRHLSELLTIWTRLKTVRGTQLELDLSDLILRNCENFVMSEAFWKTLSSDRRRAIEQFFNDTVGYKTPSFPGLKANLFR